MAEPNIVKGQIALDPVNDLLYYVNESNTIIATSLSWLKNDNNISTVENVVISGDLTVSGTTFTVNTETLLIEDNIIVLNNNYSGNAETDVNAKNAGIEVERGTQPNVLVRWNESTNKWQFSNDGTLYYNIVGEGNVNLTLGTDTTGDYVSSLNAGTGITLTNNSGESATPTIAVNTSVIQARVANVTDTEIGYLYGVSSAIQTQLNVKAPLASPTFTGTVTVPTPVSNTDASTKAYVDSTASTTAGNASTALTNHEADTTNIHGIVDTSILVTTTGSQTLTNKTITSPSGLVKGDVGLGNVDNTSDANKPVSTAGQASLDLKAPIASPTFTGTVTLPDNTVALGSKTTGDYVQSLVAGTGVTLQNNSGESATPTISIGQNVSTNATVTFHTVNANLVGDVTGQISDISNHYYINQIDSGNNIIVTTGFGIGPVPVEIATSATPNFSSVSSTTLYVDGVEIDTTGAQNEQVLKFNSALNKFVPGTDNATVPGSLGSINEHNDVTITSASNGQVLKWNGTAWVNAADNAGTTINSIDDITDVTITSANSGEFLKWNGTAWVNDVIDLATDTSGSFVQSLVAGTGITLTNNSGESATPTIAVTSNTYDAYGAAATAATNAATALTNHESDATNIHGIADTSILVTTTGTQTLTNKTITSPSGLLKNDVGLGNVDNTSDANKPVSTAQQTALDLKAPIASPTFTGTVTLPTGTVTSTMIADATIADADISTTAAISLGKLADATIDIKTGSYTLQLTDKNKFIKMNITSTANTVTVPLDATVAFPEGSQIHIIQYGSGKTQIVGASGAVYIYATPGAYLRAQYSSATLLKCAAANTWMLMGDLSAS